MTPNVSDYPCPVLAVKRPGYLDEADAVTFQSATPFAPREGSSSPRQFDPRMMSSRPTLRETSGRTFVPARPTASITFSSRRLYANGGNWVCGLFGGQQAPLAGAVRTRLGPGCDLVGGRVQGVGSSRFPAGSASAGIADRRQSSRRRESKSPSSGTFHFARGVGRMNRTRENRPDAWVRSSRLCRVSEIRVKEVRHG